MKKVLFFLSVAAFALVAMTKPAPTTYKVDTSKSTFKWTGKKVAGSHWGYIKFAGGNLQLEKGVLKGGTFNVDMNSMDCQDLQGEWGDKLIEHLKNEDFFATDKYPTATLVIKSATAKTAGQYEVVGDLTIKGITKEVKFPATVKTEGNTATATANFDVNRTQYDIKYGSGNFFDNLGDKAIDDNFNVDVNIVATTESAAPATPAKSTNKAPKKKG